MSFCLLTRDTLVCLTDSQWGTSRLASSTGHLAYRIQCEKMAKEGVLAGVSTWTVQHRTPRVELEATAPPGVHQP